MANQFKVHLQWQECSDAIRPAPLVVLLPWVWAERRHTDKYADLAMRNGWDVLTASWPMQAMWFPTWAQRLAMTLIEALGASLLLQGERPLVFWAFSGSAKGVFSSVLNILSGHSSLSPQQTAASTAILRCCCGVMYDSCPVDFTSDIGKKLLAPAMYTSNNWNSTASRATNLTSGTDTSPAGNNGDSRSLRAANAARITVDIVAGWSVGIGAGLLDFFLLEWFDRDREAMWRTLENPPVHGPFVFLYSRGDELADASRISHLANTLRQRGHPVVEQVWQDTPHCGHYRYHVQQYEEIVSYFYNQALQYWSNKRARLLQGRQLAARWEEQPSTEQQEQQQLVRQPTQGMLNGGSGSCSANGRGQQQQTSLIQSSTRNISCDHCCGHSRPLEHVHGPSGGSQVVLRDRCHSFTEKGSSNCSPAATSCCCSNDMLAAAAVLAVADAVHTAAAGLEPFQHAKQQKHPAHELSPGKQRPHRLGSRNHPDSSACSTGGNDSRSAIANSYWTKSSPTAATAMAATDPGVVVKSLISPCGCHAMECRCAETLAAANGEIDCSDSATLAHSLRCMASSHMRWQQENFAVWRRSGCCHQQHLNHNQEDDKQGAGAQNACTHLQQTINSSSNIGDLVVRGAHGTCLNNVSLQQQEGRNQQFAQGEGNRVRSRL